MHEEKRKYSRVDTLLYVTLSDGKKFLKEFVRDASPGGLMIESSEPWEVGTLLDMVIDTRISIKAKGRVVWVKKGERAYNMGIEFEDLDDETGGALVNLLFRFQDMMTR